MRRVAVVTTLTVVLTIALVMLVGCAPSPSVTPATPVTTTTTADRDAVVSAYQDWIARYQQVVDDFVSAADASDFDAGAEAMERVGTMADEGLTLPDLGAPDTAWDSAMADLRSASAVGVPALRARDVAGMTEATSYIQKATVHIKAATALLEGSS